MQLQELSRRHHQKECMTIYLQDLHGPQVLGSVGVNRAEDWQAVAVLS